MTNISSTGMINTTFHYDPNGNQISGNGRTANWTSYNKPSSITQGSTTISFLDGPDHQRFQQVTAQGTILYMNGFGAHAELVMGSSSKWNEYLTVGNVMVGVRFVSGGTTTMRYFHTDHLGSISVITDANGNVLERLSYDAWGKRRFPNGADDPADSITSQTTRGFTNQEELSVSGLVHLNGRIYDPLFGRMMSADPTVPDPLNAQAWNRYSYVGNDPLTFTDPNGFSWLSNIFHDISVFFRAIFANPLVRAVVQIAIAAILAPTTFGIGTILAAAASAAIVTGLSGGKLIDIVKAAAIAGATALAFYEVGSVTGFHLPTLATLNSQNVANFAANIAGHAAIGCLSAVASGGRCEAGAISAAAGAAAAPLVGEIFEHPDTDIGDRLGGSAVSGVVGGLAAIAGGGKFEDGAITAAFGYLFNAGAGNRGPSCDAACEAHGEMQEQNFALNMLFGLATLPFAIAYDTLQDVVLAGRALTSVFWTGAGAQNAAEAWAAANGGQMLSVTAEATPQAIRDLSLEFARNASGIVDVFQPESYVTMGRTWSDIEYPALMANPAVTGLRYQIFDSTGKIVNTISVMK